MYQQIFSYAVYPANLVLSVFIGDKFSCCIWTSTSRNGMYLFSCTVLGAVSQSTLIKSTLIRLVHICVHVRVLSKFYLNQFSTM
uniref:Uncharacterized protein n=1 Tax=Arundo donax TaxID=35708 RepID=A0A0A8ZEL0_ARUDO